MRYDEDMNGYLAFDDFNTFYYKIFGKELTTDAFDALLGEYDSTDEGVSRDGFREFMAQMGEAKLKDAIKRLGYDDDFLLVAERRFVVAVHSERMCSLVRRQSDADLARTALHKWVEAQGTPTEYDNGNLIVYQLSRDTAGTTLAVKSNYEGSVRITLDCSQSENVGTTSGNLIAEKLLTPGAMSVFHHLYPLKA